jgi:glycosyltransferase involved in cell wall biosynthesis
VRWRHGADCRRTCIQCLPFFAARKLASRSVRGVVGVSRSIVEAHRASGFFPNAKATHVIHNAGPEVGASPVPRDLKREVTFGFLGRLEAAKGVDLLVETFAHRCDGRLLIAGAGVADYADELQRRASAASIELVGHVDTAQFFDRIDVLIVPSLWQEPLSRAALEAQAYGVPVIASRRGGLVELIDDGVTGLLFDPDQPGSLPAAIDRLVASPDLFRRLSEAGLAEARKRTRERHVREYLEVYEKIAADRP